MNFECRKVQALMSLYIDGALSNNLQKFVYEHLQKCKLCMQKYLELKRTMNYLRENFQKISSKITTSPVFDVIEHENFKIIVSEYLDDELRGNNALVFKNILDKSQYSKEYFSDAVKTNTLLKKYLEQNSPELRKDFSKKVVQTVENMNKNKLFTFRDIFIICILAFLLLIFFYSVERMIFPNSQNSLKPNMTYSKIMENFFRANLKNFMY